MTLTNVSRTFQGSCLIETGLSDFPLMTLTITKKTFKKQRPLTLFRMGFFRAAYECWGGGGGRKAPLPKIFSHISYNDETWHGYTLPKEDPKNIWITWHISCVLLTSAFFHQKSSNLTISRNTDIDCILIYNFYLF